MSQAKSKPVELAELRDRAESALRQQLEAAPQMSLEEVRDLIQELGTHQIELEIENQKLRQAQEELRESAATYRGLIETTSDWTWEVNAAGVYTYASPQVESILGYRVDEVVGKTPFDFMPQEEAERLASLFMEEAEKGKPIVALEHVALCKDGQRVILETSGVPLLDAAGNVVSYRGVDRDITERKQAEEHLERESNMRAALLDGIPNCIAMILKKGTREIVASNKFAAEMGAVPGQKCFKTCSMRETPCPWCLASELWETGQSQEAEIEYRGSWYEGIWRPLSDDLYVHYIYDVTERKQSEELLRDSEAKLRAIADYTYDWESWFGPDGKLLWLNPAVEKLTGYSMEECREMPDYPLPIVHADDRALLGERLRLAVQEQISANNIEFRISHKSGSIEWMAASWQPMFDAQDRHVGQRVSIRDITVFKRLEEELRELQRRDHAWLEHSPVCTKVLDLDFNLQYMSTAGIKALQIDDIVEHYGKPYPFHFYPDSFKDQMGANLRKARDTGEVVQQEASVLDTAGNELWYHSTIVPVYDDNGHMDYIMVLSTETTDRKSAEEKLKETLAVLQAAMDCSTAGIAIAEAPDGKLRYVNAAGLGIPAGTKQELVDGIGIDEYVRSWHLTDFDGNPLAADEVPLARAIIHGESSDKQFVIHRQNGEAHVVWATAAPITNESGEVIAGVVVFPDITELVNAENERERLSGLLAQARKMEAVGQLAGGVAHDFNNILQAIVGFSELAQNVTDEDHPAHPFVKQILESADRAKQLVGQLLAFSRRQVLQMEDLDLNNVISDILKMLRRLIGTHITLDFLPDGDIGTVQADRGQIAQILTNLCVNANDAMPDGGAIRVETRDSWIDEPFCESRLWARPGRYVCLSVEDTGCGMDEEVLAQVFEPFFTTKDVGKGTGLGLSTVYGLVTQHDGGVEVKSEVGKGTIFTIYFPVVERPAAVIDKTESIVVGGTETILLADDDKMVREVCRDMLQQAGYKVFIANDGEQALRVFAEHADEIDLALLDVVMPNLGGRAVFERIQETHPQMRILFASGYSTDAIHTNFILDENLTLIQKPCQRTDLLRAVRRALDNE